jgi:hypothetical protein
MEYLDFELRIMPGGGREYPVSVLQSPAGETSATMRFPFDTLALQNQLQGIEIAVLRSGGTRRDVASDEPQMGVREFGRKLFESLMSDTVRETYRRSQDRARVSGKGLRVRLRIEAPELASLPWEYLFDPAEGDFVCLSTDTPLVRYLEFDRPPEALTIQPPLSILGVIASPSDRPALDVSREKQRVDAAIAGLRGAGLLTLTWLGGSTWRDLQKAMRQGQYHIFHFIGHGGFDSAAGEGVIALTDDQGKSSLLSATQLGRLLADHQSLRMVILNSCLGAKGSTTDVFSSTASILVRRGVSAVVAMQYEISDLAAIEFSRSLYEALADGMPVDAAVAEARKAISLSVNNTVEWGTPVLHMRAPDGKLFNIHGMTTSMARASGTYHSMPAPVMAEAADRPIPPKSPPPKTEPPSRREVPRETAPTHPAAPGGGGGGRRGLLAGLVAGVVALIAGGYFLFGRPHGPSHITASPHPDNQQPPDSADHPRVTDQSGFGQPPDPVVITPSSTGTTKDEKKSGGGSHQPPVIPGPWISTKASVAGMRADTASTGVWNMVLTVDYTGPSKDTQTPVDCVLRPGEAEQKSLRYVVPLEHGRKGGDYTVPLSLSPPWPDGSYPVSCTVDGKHVYDGAVHWSNPPVNPNSNPKVDSPSVAIHPDELPRPPVKNCPSATFLTAADLNRGATGYTMRPGRCEGEFPKAKEPTSPLVVASLTAVLEAVDLTSHHVINVSWPAPTVGDVHVRARRIQRNDGGMAYLMDAFVPTGSTSYEWPTDVVSSLGLKTADFGVVAWTYKPVGGASRLVYLPLRVSGSSAAPSATSYALVLFPTATLGSVTVLFGPANADGTPIPSKQTKIEPKPQGTNGISFAAERPIRVSLPAIESPGLYSLQISESVWRGAFDIKAQSEKPIIIDASTP